MGSLSGSTSEVGVYGDLLRDFESLKEKYRLILEAYGELSSSCSSSVVDRRLERHVDSSSCCQSEISKYQGLYHEMLEERNQFKQQCGQAIKQWDSVIRERNDYKEALSTAQRKHDEALKEVNQVISVKLKASKDLKRLTEERNAAMQEYSLIMSERDSVHKEIERLQDELSTQKKALSKAESQAKHQEVDRRKMYCHIEILKREIDNSLHERDKALREVTELRERIGISGAVGAASTGRPPSEDAFLYLKNCKNFIDKIDSDMPKRNLLSLKSGDPLNTFNKCETLEEANAEISRLLKQLEKLQMELNDARIEADIDKGRRDLAFSERDKILLEREAIRTLCDKLRHERDRADGDLAEANRDSGEIKTLNKRLHLENSKLRTRIDEFKKGGPPTLKGRSNTVPAAISGEDIWETRTLDIFRSELFFGEEEQLAFELTEERDSLGSSLLRVSSVRPESNVSGRLHVDDYILSINDAELTGLPLSKVLDILQTSNLQITLRVTRRHPPRISTHSFDIKNNQEVGLSLQTGFYVAGVMTGSLAEGRLSLGDRILALDDWSLDSASSLTEVRDYLNVPRNSLRVTFLRSVAARGSSPPRKRPAEEAKPRMHHPFSIKSLGEDFTDNKQQQLQQPTEKVKLTNSRQHSSMGKSLGREASRGVFLGTRRLAGVKSPWKKRETNGFIFGGTWPRVKSGPNISAEAVTGKMIVQATPESSKEPDQSSKSIAFFKLPDRRCSKAGFPSMDDSVKSAHGRDDDFLVRYLKRSKESPRSLLEAVPRRSSGLPKRVNCEPGRGWSMHEPFGEDHLLPPTRHTHQRSVGNNSLSPRIRIPSNTSVTSNSSVSKVSLSSMDKSFNKCSSPLPFYSIGYLSQDGRISEATHLSGVSGEIRQISIQKSSEQLGFTIEGGHHKGGVFVSSVNENSLAQLVGLQVGDQLLEVCGINLRSCGKEQAARVLHQVGHSITLKVQYNPEESLLRPSSRESSVESEDEVVEQSSNSGGESCDSEEEELLFLGGNNNSNNNNASAPPPSYADSLSLAARGGMNASPPYEPRLVYPRLKPCGSDLGVRLVGGNAVGIFIHSVEPGSPAYKAGLRSADQILEYDGVDLRSATAEQAAYELAKPAEHPVGLLVQYNPDRYTAVKDGPGDSYYVRCLFDRRAGSTGSVELSFYRDDILYVDNTMYNGVPGHWSAWMLDSEGRKTTWGVIPSKYKVEEELLTRKSLGNLDVERRGWTSSTRRSFFKRKKTGGGYASSRSGSVPKELASYSDRGSLSDSGNLLEESLVNSYLRVERFDSQITRPVLLIGPYSELVVDKLVHDYPQKFFKCETEVLDCEYENIERGLQEGVLIDIRRRACRSFEVTSLRAVKEGTPDTPDTRHHHHHHRLLQEHQHCILNIHIESVERLHLHQIYPIVLLLKFKSIKQIRELKDPRLSLSKISHKDAKNIFEYTQKLENEHRHFISDVVHAGANLMLICTQIASQIQQEQGKTLWVPSGSIW